jgi:hypothetical protein
MTTRISERTVTFQNPFVLRSFDEVLPAGTYSVETHEEPLEGISFAAYRRVLTLIHLHAKPGHPAVTQVLKIDPNDLDTALMRDLASADGVLGRNVSQEIAPVGPKIRTDETRRRDP